MTSEKLNFILIVSDTFRWDLLNYKFEVKSGVYAKTPNLNEFYRKSIAFTRAYHASFPTVPHRLDLLTGKFTFTYYDWSPLPKSEVTLPMILKKRDYVSAMIVDTPHIMKDGYNFDRGFDGWVWIRGQENDRYRTAPKEIKLPCSSEKIRNVNTLIQHMRNNYHRRFEEDWIPAKTASEAMKWLEENYERKFFLYVDFFDPHEPWDPPRWYVDMYDPGYVGDEVTYPVYGPRDYLTDEELTHIRAMYAGEATLVDKWIGALLKKVEELGLYENTTIVFTSDHGFMLGEHGYVGKSIIVGEYHGLMQLYEEICHVPLIIKPAETLGWEVGREIDELVQTPDIAATIIELAGLRAPEGVQGVSLTNLIEERVERVRDIAISTPSLIRGVRAGLRPTITSKEWSLILASEAGPKGLEEAEYTMIVDGIPRKLKPFGRITTELYNLGKDPRQEKNVLKENLEVARELHEKFINSLKELGASEEIIKPWLKVILD